jgi:hypothetical protein
MCLFALASQSLHAAFTPPATCQRSALHGPARYVATYTSFEYIFYIASVQPNHVRVLRGCSVKACRFQGAQSPDPISDSADCSAAACPTPTQKSTKSCKPIQAACNRGHRNPGTAVCREHPYLRATVHDSLLVPRWHPWKCHDILFAPSGQSLTCVLYMQACVAQRAWSSLGGHTAWCRFASAAMQD